MRPRVSVATPPQRNRASGQCGRTRPTHSIPMGRLSTSPRAAAVDARELAERIARGRHANIGQCEHQRGCGECRSHSVTDARSIQRHVADGTCVPQHWFVEGLVRRRRALHGRASRSCGRRRRSNERRTRLVRSCATTSHARRTPDARGRRDHLGPISVEYKPRATGPLPQSRRVPRSRPPRPSP